MRCPTGEARITPSGDLRARFVIHTVGPIYDSDEASAPLLSSAYRNSLRLANDEGLKAVAFPAISCGVFGYPLAAAAKVGEGGSQRVMHWGRGLMVWWWWRWGGGAPSSSDGGSTLRCASSDGVAPLPNQLRMGGGGGPVPQAVSPL